MCDLICDVISCCLSCDMRKNVYDKIMIENQKKGENIEIEDFLVINLKDSLGMDNGMFAC